MCQACPSAIAEKDAYGHTALQHAIMSNNSDAEAAVLAVIAGHPSAVRVLCPDGAPLLKLAKDNKRVSEAIVDAITSAWPEAVAATEAAAPALVPITKGTIYLSAAGGIMGSRIAISEAARQAAIQERDDAYNAYADPILKEGCVPKARMLWHSEQNVAAYDQEQAEQAVKAQHSIRLSILTKVLAASNGSSNNDVPPEALSTDGLCKAILDLGRDIIKIKTQDGDTLLHLALRCKVEVATAVAAALVAACPDICKEKNEGGKTPLHLAIEAKDGSTPSSLWSSLAETLVAAFPGGVKERDTYGNNPLHNVLQTYSDLREPLVLTMTAACPEAASGISKGGEMPFYIALRCEASEAVQLALIDAWPHAAYKKNDLNGRVPLYTVVMIMVNSENSKTHLYAPRAAPRRYDEVASFSARIDDSESWNASVSATVAEKLFDIWPAAVNEPDLLGTTLLGKVLHMSAPADTTNAGVLESLMLRMIKEATIPETLLLQLPGSVDRHAAHTPIREALHGIVDRDDNTLLHLAVQTRGFTNAVVDAVFEAMPQATGVQNIDGITPLHNIIQDKVGKGYDEDIQYTATLWKRMVEACPNAVLLKSGISGCNTLHMVLHNRGIDKNIQTQLVSDMIAICPAAVLAKDPVGRSPLYLALQCDCQQPVVSVLIAAHPDATSELCAPTSHGGDSPLDYWAKYLVTVRIATLDDVKLAKVMIAEFPKAAAHPISCLGNTVLHGVIDMVGEKEKLRQLGQLDDVDALDLLVSVVEALASACPEAIVASIDYSPNVIHYALKRNASAKLVSVLIAANVDAVLQADGSGKTTLGLALDHELSGVVQVILAQVPKALATKIAMERDGFNATLLHRALIFAVDNHHNSSSSSNFGPEGGKVGVTSTTLSETDLVALIAAWPGASGVTDCIWPKTEASQLRDGFTRSGRRYGYGKRKPITRSPLEYTIDCINEYATEDSWTTIEKDTDALKRKLLLSKLRHVLLAMLAYTPRLAHEKKQRIGKIIGRLQPAMGVEEPLTITTLSGDTLYLRNWVNLILCKGSGTDLTRSLAEQNALYSAEIEAVTLDVVKLQLPRAVLFKSTISVPLKIVGMSAYCGSSTDGAGSHAGVTGGSRDGGSSHRANQVTVDLVREGGTVAYAQQKIEDLLGVEQSEGNYKGKLSRVLFRATSEDGGTLVELKRGIDDSKMLSSFGTSWPWVAVVDGDTEGDAGFIYERYRTTKGLLSRKPKLDPTKGELHKTFKLRQQELQLQQPQQRDPTEADLQALETVLFKAGAGGVAMQEQRAERGQSTLSQ